MSTTYEYWASDRKNLWHPLTRNRYLDAIASWWACNLGHSHPRIVEAIRKQAGELQHSILANRSHPRAVAFASRLIEQFPDPDRKAVFASDGASAVEAALRVAVQYWYNIGHPERHRIVALEQGYHGDTFGAMSVGYVPDFHKPYAPLLFKTFQAERPYCAGCIYGQTPDSCELECFASMEHIFEEHSDEIAAVIIEPLCQGAGGMRIYSPAYLTRLADLCRKHGVLLIADEIAMGLGRTGRMFAFQHAGVDPDIVCLGKNLSGGALPLSSAVVKDYIYDTFSDTPEDHTFYHGHTFAGNPIACAAGLAAFDIMAEEDIVARADDMGKEMGRLIRSFEECPGVKEIRSLGMLAAFDLEDTEKETGAERAQRIRKALLPHGILLRPLGNIIYLMPPLILTREQLTETVDALYDAVRETAGG